MVLYILWLLSADVARLHPANTGNPVLQPLEVARMTTFAIRLVSCLALLVLATSCVDTTGWIQRCDHNLPERGKWANPLYSGAQNAKHEAGQCCSEITTTFETTDSPETVIAHYEQVLGEAGWEGGSSPTGEQSDLRFGVANCCYYGHLTVTATRTSAGMTAVEVYSAWSMGCG